MLWICSLLIRINLGYVWFPQNVKEYARKRKYEGKVRGKKNKIKKRIKSYILFLLTTSNKIYSFSSLIYKLNNLRIGKFLSTFNYICKFLSNFIYM